MLRVTDPAQFRYRVAYAARCLMHGRTHTRTFDTCFEMGDGAEVVAALMHRAARNPRLLHAIHQWLTPDGLRQWQDTAAAFPSLALRDLEATARQKHWTWVDRQARPCSCAWCQRRSPTAWEVSPS
ncbi:hypothetical protein SAMN00768000_3643 [Sulfobacillus thermosulfidooxidans DSM 9293]|uniref:Uncharacterized protein n=1 Tax=Sulfobacillus thermosulfidooxidans (strain DSM 9293 / VKM B-1269 / AT-1) TaxID=929705 RepID=A0A1W1WQ03_SULTA|nr:hypothetical protein [Sulfobacillus thermosulfidooxidans]SMC08090.1 hypothetical protein SAMN00768000_3643 [Sulfobacillus thermosulfidooxidans DSM 9293]